MSLHRLPLRTFYYTSVPRHSLRTTAVPLFKPSSQPRHSSTSTPPADLNEAERAIYAKLSTNLQPSTLSVKDISGGCGSMYGVEIASPMFEGLSVVKQHKMVNKVLEEEIRGWHGMQLKTRAG